ncbi:MAG: hypothetical protein HY021_12455, partial [Burkholderiales bacterium]|nr:hypothetical protein [Burkholderiales bacterium]
MTRSRVAGVTEGLSRRARDTVILLTPANAARSSIVCATGAAAIGTTLGFRVLIVWVQEETRDASRNDTLVDRRSARRSALGPSPIAFPNDDIDVTVRGSRPETLSPLTDLAHARTHLDASPPLQFSVDDGGRQSWFYRDANVAAQVVVSRGAVPRLIVAFCAGDSAVAAWFDAGGVPLDWRLRAAPRPLSTRDARGRVLHGLQFEIEARVASLRVIRAQLGSARTAREVQAGAE